MSKWLSGLLAVSMVALLAGCATPTPTPTPTRLPTSTRTPAAPPTFTPTTFPTSRPSPTATAAPTATRALPTVTASPVPPSPTPSPVPTPSAELGPIVWSLVVTPEEPPRFYAVVDDALYQSDDRGATWQAADLSGVAVGAFIWSVAVDYRNPSVMYLTTSEGIFRRVGAEAWAFVHPLQAMALAVDFVDSNVLWAGVSFTTEYNAVILKSTDGGRTWGKADLGISAWVNYAVRAIVIDPTNPNILYANVRYGGRFGWPEGWVYRGGRDGHWEPLNLPSSSGSEFSEDACMPNGLAFDPNLRRLYVGCDAYYYNEDHLLLLRSDNAYAEHSEDVAWKWAASFGMMEGYVFGGVRALAVDAREPKSLFVAVNDARLGQPAYRIMVSHDDGATWEDLQLSGLPGREPR